jgi:hypothetical protein
METRRTLLALPVIGIAVAGTAGALFLGGGATPEPEAPPVQVTAVASDVGTVEVHKSVTCGCCGGHVEHLEAAGFTVEEHLYEDAHATAEMKRRTGVPEEMWSCHTTLVGGYAIEGHVPADVIAQLLAEAPEVDGIALPGMPAGSPGMEGTKDGPWTFESFDDAESAGTFTVR